MERGSEHRDLHNSGLPASRDSDPGKPRLRWIHARQFTEVANRRKRTCKRRHPRLQRQEVLYLAFVSQQQQQKM